jgi:hypothetical protein
MRVREACPCKQKKERGTTEKAGAMGAEEVVQTTELGPIIASDKTRLVPFLKPKKTKKEGRTLFNRKPNLSVRP